MWNSCKTLVFVLVVLVFAAGGWWSAEASEAAKPAGRTPVIADAIEGSVVDAKGKAIAGARLAITASFNEHWVCSEVELLGETTSDSRGFFRLPIRPLPPKKLSTLFCAGVVVSASGYGVRVEYVELNGLRKMPAIKLEKERSPIGGRLVDETGKPVAGLRVHLRSVQCWNCRPSIESPGVETRAWPQAATTDAEGRFAFHNIGRAFSFPMTVEIFLYDAAETPKTRQVVAVGESKGVDFRILPVVQGRVTCRESGLPIAAADILVIDSYTVWLSVQSVMGSHFHTTTDTQGRFLLWHGGGGTTTMSIEAPAGMPRLTARQRLPTDPRTAIFVTNIALPRGIMLRGKVVEAETGIPVKSAGLMYYSDASECPMFPKVAFGESKAVTDAAGIFEVEIADGRGSLSIWRSKEHDFRSVAWSKIENGVPVPVSPQGESGFKVVRRSGSDAREMLIEVRRLPPAKKNGARTF